MNVGFSERKDSLSLMLARRGPDPRTLSKLLMSGLAGKGSLFAILKLIGFVIQTVGKRKMSFVLKEFPLAVGKGGGRR